jgi:hypothetical protein
MLLDTFTELIYKGMKKNIHKKYFFLSNEAIKFFVILVGWLERGNKILF